MARFMYRRLTPALVPLHQGSDRGASLVTAMILAGVMGLVVFFIIERNATMMQLNQSDLLKSDFAAIERTIADNISCPKTLGPPLTLCSPNTPLLGTDGTRITNSAGFIGGFKITTNCIDATPSDPNKRLVIFAQADRPEPLFPTAGPAKMQMFKHGANYAPNYPCVKYLNVGPRYQVAAAYSGTGAFNFGDCSCGFAAGRGWCHNKGTATCPPGYQAVSANTDCTYTYPYGGVPRWGNLQGAAVGSVTSAAATLTAAQGTVDCCAPPAAQNPLYLICIRS